VTNERDEFEEKLGQRLGQFADGGLPAKTPDEVALTAMRSPAWRIGGVPVAVGVLGLAVVLLLQVGRLGDIGSPSASPEASTPPGSSISPEASTSPVGSVPGDTNPPGPLPSDESNTRSFTPMIESPEIGVDYDVYLSLHCGYSNVQQVGFGGTLWSFTENGSADSIYVEGTLRLVSADSATLTVDVALVTGVLTADGTAHPLVPATDDGGCI